MLPSRTVPYDVAVREEGGHIGRRLASYFPRTDVRALDAVFEGHFYLGFVLPKSQALSNPRLVERAIANLSRDSACRSYRSMTSNCADCSNRRLESFSESETDMYPD